MMGSTLHSQSGGEGAVSERQVQGRCLHHGSDSESTLANHR